MSRRMILPTAEQGSALITVLIMLVLITLVGVVAIRQGLLSLNMATGSQMQTLLFHNSDVGIDQTTRALATKQDILDARDHLGIVGSAVLTGNELVFCQTPDTTVKTLFTKPNRKLGIVQSLQPDGQLAAGNETQFCDATKLSSFLSNRQVSMTQVAVMQAKEADGAVPFSMGIPGTDSPCWQGVPDSQCPTRVRVYTTAVLPAASQAASDADVNGCLRKSNDAWRMKEQSADPTQAPDTVTDCLTKLGVPFNTQTDDYQLMVRIPSPRS